MKKFFNLLAIIIILAACSGKTEQTEPSVVNKVANTSSTVNSEQRAIIKESTIRLRTSNIDATYSKIKSSLKAYSAYFAEENSQNDNSSKNYEVIVRVPSKNMDAFINSFIKDKSIIEVEDKTLSLQDVTEEYVDVQARIKVKKEYELKLIELLKKAKNITETIEIQKQLNELRVDIEKSEGRKKFLDNQINYSTVRITFYEDIKLSTHFFSSLWDSLKAGWQVFLYIINALAYLWIIIIIILASVFGSIYYKKRKISRKNNIK